MTGPASDPVRRPAAVYGLIERDGSYQPTVIVGCCIDVVLRDIIAIFTARSSAGVRCRRPFCRLQAERRNPVAPIL